MTPRDIFQTSHTPPSQNTNITLPPIPPNPYLNHPRMNSVYRVQLLDPIPFVSTPLTSIPRPPPPLPKNHKRIRDTKNMGTVGTILRNFEEKREVISNFRAISIWVGVLEFEDWKGGAFFFEEIGRESKYFSQQNSYEEEGKGRGLCV